MRLCEGLVDAPAKGRLVRASASGSTVGCASATVHPPCGPLSRSAAPTTLEASMPTGCLGCAVAPATASGDVFGALSRPVSMAMSTAWVSVGPTSGLVTPAGSPDGRVSSATVGTLAHGPCRSGCRSCSLVRSVAMHGRLAGGCTGYPSCISTCFTSCASGVVAPSPLRSRVAGLS